MRQGVTVLQRLFENMPQSFSRHPYPIPAVVIRNTGYASDKSEVSIIIADGKMVINSYSKYINSETINLKNYTLYALSNYFYKHYPNKGLSMTWDAYIDSSTKNVLASSLLEGSSFIDGEPTFWNAFSSENYKFLMPISLSLVENYDYMRSFIYQIDQRLASGKWIDFWGNAIGLNRHDSEILEDLQYKLRIRHEISYPKVNNVALNQIIQIAGGPKVYLSDGSAPVRTPEATNPLFSPVATGKVDIHTVAGSNLIWAENGGNAPVIKQGTISVGDRITCSGYIKPETEIIEQLPLIVNNRWYYVLSKPALLTTTNVVEASTFAIGIASFLPIVSMALGTANVGTTNGTTYMTVVSSATNPAQGYFPPFHAETNPITYEGKLTKTSLPVVHSFPTSSGGNESLFQIEYSLNNTSSGLEGTYALVGTQPDQTAIKVYTLPYGYGSQQSNEAFNIGPTTGNRIINVTINTENGKYDVTQKMYDRILFLLNKWKPAGIRFAIKIV